MNKHIVRNILILLILCFMTFLNSIPALAITASNDDYKEKINEFIRSRMKIENVPGVSLAVVKGNEIYYLQGYGRAGKGRTVTPETPFILGSLSKSFTGLAIMQLAEKGKIDINAPVVKYLPWFRLNDPVESSKITLRDLLSHTSGLSTLSGREALTRDNIPIEQLLKNQNKTELSKPVGSTYQYSNLNYIILGEIIQSVTGEPYDKYITENIFKPLDMKHSYTSVAEAKKNGLASGYIPFLGFMASTRISEHKASVPAGYLISSAEDMAHFLIAEMNGGSYNGNSIISAAGMEKTHEPLNGGAYYAGWAVYPGVLWHNGATENFTSEMMIDNDDGWGIAVLCNFDDFTTGRGVVDNNLINGVNNILKGMDPGLYNPPTNKIPGIIIISIEIIILILLALGCFRMLKWKPNKLNLGIKAIVLLIENILLPILIITVVPKITARFLDATVGNIIAFAPDLGTLIILAPTILLIIGIVKLILLISFLRENAILLRK